MERLRGISSSFGIVFRLALVLTIVVGFQNCSTPLDLENPNDSLTAEDFISMTSIPVATTVEVGGTIRMSATATSLKNRTLSYQWYKDGEALSGYGGNTLVISNSSKANEGFYYITVADGIKSITTSPVWVQVGADSTTAGTILITTQPSAMTLATGAVAYFEVIATDTAARTLSYQWYYNGVALSGQTTSQLYITNVTKSSHAGYYYVLISNGTNSLKSSTVSLVIDGSSSTCDGGTVYNSHCYVVYGTATTWSNAVTQCALAGGYLAKVTSYYESLFIANQAGQDVWIGASDSIIEGTFLWRDGTPLTYSLWGTSQPDNSSGDEDCVEILSTGYWNDLSCSASRPFVCEIE